MPQVDEKSREITTVKYGPVTSNRIFSRKNRGLLIRERFAAQTLRHNGVFFGLFHAPVASQIFQRPEKNRLVLAGAPASLLLLENILYIATNSARFHTVDAGEALLTVLRDLTAKVDPVFLVAFEGYG